MFAQFAVFSLACEVYAGAARVIVSEFSTIWDTQCNDLSLLCSFVFLEAI